VLPEVVEGDVWPATRMRRVEVVEECIAVADASDTPLPLSTARLTWADGAWAIDPVLSIDASWHGAAVVARSDGMLIGMLLFDDDEDAARVALLPHGGLAP
jgi:hypothetical protein